MRLQCPLQRFINFVPLHIIALALGVSVLPLASDAAVRTWTGLGANGNWSTAGNWSSSIAPTNGDALVFPAGAARLVNTNNTALNFESIVFTGAGGGYSLWGNILMVTNGIIASNSAGANVIHLRVTLGADQTFATRFANSSLTLASNLVLNGRDLVFDVGTATIITNGGVISGSGDITKIGFGVLDLSGANTFSGTMTVNVGELLVRDDFALGSTAFGTTVNSNGFLRLIGVQVGNEPLALNASGTIGSVVLAGGSCSWTGAVTLVASAKVGAGFGGTLNFAGAIGGTGDFICGGSGIHVFSGTNANTYSGTTYVNEGTLELRKTAGVNSIPGSVVVGDGFGAAGSDVLRSFASVQIFNSITVNISGLCDLNGFSDAIASLTLIGGDVQTGAGVLSLTGPITSIATNRTSFISGNISFFAGSHTIGVENDTTIFPELVISAVISGAGDLVKTGVGALQFTANNTYSGLTTVNQGSLTVAQNGGFGATNAGTVINGGILVIDTASITNETLTVNSAGRLDPVGANTWAGPVILNATLPVFAAGISSLNMAGVISGGGGLRKIGAGTLTLSGTGDNTYLGTTFVDDGLLALGKTGGAIALLDTSLVIGDNVGGVNADAVRYVAAGNQINVSVPITIYGSGLLDLNGFSDEVGPLTLIGGDVTTGAGVALVGGTVSAPFSTNSSSVISGILQLNTTRTFNISDSSAIEDLRIEAEVRGAGGIVKNGSGLMVLIHSNTFAGTFAIDQGIVRAEHSFALGGTNGGTIVSLGATLGLRSNITVLNESLTLAGTGGSLGAFASYSGSNAWVGPVTLVGHTTVFVDPFDMLNISGPISGLFDLTKTGTGTLIFSGGVGTANTFGTMIVHGGTQVLAKAISNASIPGGLIIGDEMGLLGMDVVRSQGGTAQINNAANVDIASNGRLELRSPGGEIIGPIVGSGQIDIAAGSQLQEDPGGTIATYDGIISGAGGLAVLGAGTFVLNGNNTYLDVTEIFNGELTVNGSQPQSPVTVSSGGLLSGHGTVGNVSVLNGTLSPGSSPGILSMSNLTFNPGTRYVVDLNATGVVTNYDQAAVRGTANLGNTALIMNVGNGFAPFEGETFVIVNNDGADLVTGTFLGKPHGSTFVEGGLEFRISYANDVFLRVTNTALRSTGNYFAEGGNNNARIEPNECLLLSFPLTNVLGGVVSGITGTLRSLTPGVSVTQPFATYPNAPAHGRTTNVEPFQLSISPGLVCGQEVRVELIYNTFTNGSFRINLILGDGGPEGPAVRFDNNTNTALVDSGVIESPITVSNISAALRRVMVSLHATHPAVGDLDISLVGPDGTVIDLSSDNGGAGANYGTSCTDSLRTTFDDFAPTFITSGTPPFSGRFRPEISLIGTVLGNYGTNVNGTWRLRIADDTAGNTGTLQCWSLFLLPSVCQPSGGVCESCPERTIAGYLSETQTMPDRLFRENVAGVCASTKSCPDLLAGPFNYDAYVFENGESNACITVTLSGSCDLFSAAYLNEFSPTNLCANYLADAGNSTLDGPVMYSFNVAARARFTVMVNNISFGDLCQYELSVTGGSCRPVLNITKVPSGVALDWTSAAIGYQLQATNRLTSTPATVWPPAAFAPAMNGSRYRVTNSTTINPRFYRLEKP